MLYFGMDHCDGRQNCSLIVTFVLNCLFININKKFESKFEHSILNTRGVERRRREEEQLGQELFHLHQL